MKFRQEFFDYPILVVVVVSVSKICAKFQQKFVVKYFLNVLIEQFSKSKKKIIWTHKKKHISCHKKAHTKK